MLIIPHNVADHASSLALLSFIDIRRTIGIRIQMTRSALVSRGVAADAGRGPQPAARSLAARCHTVAVRWIL